MITGLEIPYTFGLLYPFINSKWWLKKLLPKVEAELAHQPKEATAIQVYDFQVKVAPPTLVQVGSIMLPITGGSYTDKNLLFTKCITTDKQDEFINFTQIKDEEDTKLSYTNSHYINTQEDLQKTFTEYKIPMSQFRINLPFQVHNYHYKNGLYYHKLGDLGTQRHLVLKRALNRHSLPGTDMITLLAYGGLLGCWLFYAGGEFTSWYNNYSSYYQMNWYPPFHYKRIQGYFADTSSKK